MNEPPNPEVAVFAAALELPADQRAAYVDQACAGDAALRRQVEALLRVHDDAGNFFDKLASVARPNSAEGAQPGSSGTICPPGSPSEKPGDRIGRYKLLQQIGEGGCGVVYMAEQEEPVRRRVALKVIKLGMDTKQVIARFEAERQALAMMEHPNIAKVLDAGATDTGRPYFVMELVRGIKITQFCDEQKVATVERLRLFIQVCQAIQHAHQKGVIHRDLKPSNILVTINDGVPVPKVIDFGIAKATSGRLTDKTLFTAFEQFIGTPAYMSPEQAVMTSLDIDTRSDIYSLGVLLYELLTSKTPFDQKELLAAGLDEMRRTIREMEPPKPSTRLTQDFVAADVRRLHSKTEEEVGASSRRLLQIKETIRLVRGDLDWIVMKALEKDRSRRYETANGLAADIQRHLNNEPVVACPPSKFYEFQKTVRRHKFGFTVGLVLITVLALGVATSTLEAIRATRAEREQSRLRQIAETKENKSEQVSQFLKDMLSGVGPWVAMGRDTTLLRDIVDKTAEHVDKDLKDQPEVQAELLVTLGNIYSATGPMDKGEAMQYQSLAIRRKLFGEENLDVASSLQGLGNAYWLSGKYAEAESATRESLAIRTKILGEHNPMVADSLAQLGGILFWGGKMAESEAVSRKAVQLRRELADDSGLVWALEFLGQALDAGGKYDEAETTLREAVAISKRQVGAGHVLTANALCFLGHTLHGAGKYAEAENVLRESLAIHRIVSDQHTGMPMAWMLDELVALLKDEGKYAEAENLARETLAIKTKVQGNDIPSTIKARNVLIYILQREGKQTEADALIAGQTNAPTVDVKAKAN